MRKTIIASFMVLPGLYCSPSRLTGSPPVLIKGPMVQMVSDSGFTLVWETHQSVDVQAQVQRNHGQWAEPDKVVETRAGRRAVRFDGLNPASEYRYRIVVDEETVAEHSVRTAPKADESFRILAFGDSGSGNEHQYRLAEKMPSAGADIVVHTGDLIYMEGEREDYPEKFYRPYASLIASVPFYPSMGNHDFRTNRGAPMFEEFVLPENGPQSSTPERHYWFDFGSARFVAIDTDLTMKDLGSIVAPWLDKVLEGAGDRWKIVFFHHPVYTNGRYGPTHRLWRTILPVIEAHGTHLVLSGHDHLYERTHPIREGKITPPGQGVVHVVTGAGGHGLYAINPKPMEQIAVQYNEDYSFTVIDVSPDRMTLRQINANGEQVDEYVIPRTGSPDPLPEGNAVGTEPGG